MVECDLDAYFIYGIPNPNSIKKEKIKNNFFFNLDHQPSLTYSK